MKDALANAASLGIIQPLRKCEWCHRPSMRGGDLCATCLARHVDACHRMDTEPEPNPFFSAIRTIGGAF